jgi:hypothetical protein
MESPAEIERCDLARGGGCARGSGGKREKQNTKAIHCSDFSSIGFLFKAFSDEPALAAYQGLMRTSSNRDTGTTSDLNTLKQQKTMPQ